MTVLASDYTTRLVEGFAQLIAARTDPSVGVTWQTAGTYTANQVGIFVASVPNATGIPDRIISLTPMFYGADPTISIDRGSLQVRYRGTADIRTLWAVRDAVRYGLVGHFPVRLATGVYIGSLQLGSGVSLGQESSGTQRWSWADTYSFTATDPRH